MYPLAAQFRFAAFQAQEVVCRLRGEPEPDAPDAGAGLAIALELPDGLAFDLTGAQYARDWALPQLYFHVVSADAILRNQGLVIGKADYVPRMSAYPRTGATA